jgi:hypothetical protein
MDDSQVVEILGVVYEDAFSLPKVFHTGQNSFTPVFLWRLWKK